MIIHKYQALGNDFLIFDCINYPENYTFAQTHKFLDFIMKKSDRRRIGCDQFIVMEKSHSADCKIVFYNADGSRAEACGNGTIASSVYSSKFLGKNEITLETDVQIVNVKVDGSQATIELDMPHDLGLSEEQKDEIYGLLAGRHIDNISVGNPHCVLVYATNPFRPLNKLHYSDRTETFSKAGSQIENLTSIFPNRTNVEFVTQTGENKFDCFVWERGAGRTFACGTGACAVAFACAKNGLADKSKPIEITMAGSFIYGKSNESTPMKVILKDKTVELTNSAFFEGKIHC